MLACNSLFQSSTVEMRVWQGINDAPLLNQSNHVILATEHIEVAAFFAAHVVPS